MKIEIDNYLLKLKKGVNKINYEFFAILIKLKISKKNS